MILLRTAARWLVPIVAFLCVPALYMLSLRTDICPLCRTAINLISLPKDFRNPVYEGVLVANETRQFRIIPRYSGYYGLYAKGSVPREVLADVQLACSVERLYRGVPNRAYIYGTELTSFASFGVKNALTSDAIECEIATGKDAIHLIVFKRSDV